MIRNHKYRRQRKKRWLHSLPFEVRKAWEEAEYRIREAEMLRRVVWVMSGVIVVLLCVCLFGGSR